MRTRRSMISEEESKQVFSELARSFLFEEIRQKSLADKIAEIKIFDKGSTWYIEREGEPAIVLEPKEYVSSAFVKHESIINSDFDTVRAFYEILAKKMRDQQDKDLIQEMSEKAGLHVDAKGDILGGFIESAKQLREHNGYDDDLLLVISPEVGKKLSEALMKDPDRAKLFKELVNKRK
jgi:hypothetical protein